MHAKSYLINISCLHPTNLHRCRRRRCWRRCKASRWTPCWWAEGFWPTVAARCAIGVAAVHGRGHVDGRSADIAVDTCRLERCSREWCSRERCSRERCSTCGKDAGRRRREWTGAICARSRSGAVCERLRGGASAEYDRRSASTQRNWRSTTGSERNRRDATCTERNRRGASAKRDRRRATSAQRNGCCTSAEWHRRSSTGRCSGGRREATIYVCRCLATGHHRSGASGGGAERNTVGRWRRRRRYQNARATNSARARSVGSAEMAARGAGAGRCRDGDVTRETWNFGGRSGQRRVGRWRIQRGSSATRGRNGGVDGSCK